MNRDISSLYPAFGRIVEAFVKRWNIANPDHQVQIFEALRSMERQGELYAQGRTKPGQKATNAAPGLSWHNYGLAVDVVFDSDPLKPGPQWTWDGSQPWPKLGKYAIDNFGLEWAGNWRSFPEYPHFQNTWGLQIFEAKELFQTGELQAVWNSLDLTRQVIGRTPATLIGS